MENTTTSEEITALARRTHSNAMMFGLSTVDAPSPGTGPVVLIVTRHAKLRTTAVVLPSQVWDKGIAPALDMIHPARMEACFVAIGVTAEAYMLSRDGRQLSSRITMFVSVDDHWAMIIESENDAFPELMNDASAETNHDHYLAFSQSEATLALRNLVGRCVAVVGEDCDHDHSED
jgi:hypothetical protein